HPLSSFDRYPNPTCKTRRTPRRRQRNGGPLKEDVMSIHLVRWPDLSASLVQADGEEHLLDILDQVGNPDDCEWNIYEGPLFIDFRLPVEWSVQDGRSGTPVTPQQVVIENMGGMAPGNV